MRREVRQGHWEGCARFIPVWRGGSLVGEIKKGRELAERALGQDQDEPVVLYNVACFYALQGDATRSIELLTRAIEQGWGDREWLETDSDLDSLRDDDRFKALIYRIE